MLSISRGMKITFYDHPQESSKRLSLYKAHLFFRHFSETLQPLIVGFLDASSGSPDTPFTHSPSEGRADYRLDRPALLVSSTSWTADEDFSILIHALKLYEENAKQPNANLPKVLVFITGKGSLRAAFEKRISRLQQSWNYVRCSTVWLESADYPKLLGSWITLEDDPADVLLARCCRFRNLASL